MDEVQPNICWYAIGGPCLETPKFMIAPWTKRITMAQAAELAIWACPEHKDKGISDMTEQFIALGAVMASDPDDFFIKLGQGLDAAYVSVSEVGPLRAV